MKSAPLVGFHLGRIGPQDQRAFLRGREGFPLTLAANFGCHAPVKKESLLNQGDSPLMQIRHVEKQKK
jgi:hypothetical protein